MTATEPTTARGFYDTGRHPYMERLNEDCVRWCAMRGADGPILDVGGNYGHAVHFARQQYGWAGDAVDLNPQDVWDDVRVHRGDAGAGDLTALFTPQAFGLAFMCHSLEHLDNYRRALSDLHMLVRPGGHLFVAVPHPDSFNWVLDDGAHVTAFTWQLLEAQCRLFGWERQAWGEPVPAPDRRNMWSLWRRV